MKMSERERERESVNERVRERDSQGASLQFPIKINHANTYKKKAEEGTINL